MKNAVKYILVFVVFTNQLSAQVLTFAKGNIEFYSATTLSDIDAFTENAEVSLDLQNGNVEVVISIPSFEFEYELMQEHFNEKYLESDKFPTATFKGKILQDISNSFTTETEVDVSGQLTIHGVSKEVAFKAKLLKQEELLLVKAKLLVLFKDFNIDEPSILSKSVAKDVEVKCSVFLK